MSSLFNSSNTFSIKLTPRFYLRMHRVETVERLQDSYFPTDSTPIVSTFLLILQVSCLRFLQHQELLLCSRISPSSLLSYNSSRLISSSNFPLCWHQHPSMLLYLPFGKNSCLITLFSKGNTLFIFYN